MPTNKGEINIPVYEKFANASPVKCVLNVPDTPRSTHDGFNSCIIISPDLGLSGSPVRFDKLREIELNPRLPSLAI